MGEGKGDRGGFGKGFGKGGGKGKGKKGNKGKRGGKKDDEKDWTPLTKLGRLVKDGKIKSLEQIYLFSLPIKEYQIIDFFLGPKLKEEVMKVMPVQKQTSAGQRTRFKAFVVMGKHWPSLTSTHIFCCAELGLNGALTDRCFLKVTWTDTSVSA